jgi:putative DNA primase/helicase
MPSEPVARVLNLLQNVALISGGWTARCPAHVDRVNSLSIAEGSDGRALIHCHAGCAFEDVVAALGITVRSLFVQRGRSR